MGSIPGKWIRISYPCSISRISLEKYIPAFSYELYDVSHMPEEQIKGEVELRIVLMAFRYIFHPEIMSRLKRYISTVPGVTR
jgi:hypothetical protein